MVQRVFSQIRALGIDVDITIATCETQKTSIEAQIDGKYSLILEPERRDTAPAIMLSCEHLIMEQSASLDDTVIVMPIDTYADQSFYDSVILLDETVQTGQADLVLMGASPTYPSEKYGYIIPKDRSGKACPVKEFKEKPSEQAASEYIAAGGLWNCGVFAFKLRYIDSLVRNQCKATSYNEFLDNYNVFPKNSFDYAVVESAKSISVIPYTGAWKDLGTWNTLTEEMNELESGRVAGIDTCKNTHVINELGIPLVALGLEDLVVVATPDGILVSDKHQSSYMKPFVTKVAESRPMCERRNWGTYRVIDSSIHPDSAKSITKELVISTGCQLSYQRHFNRSEAWTIVSGCGEIVLDGTVREVVTGSVVMIEKGQMHAARAVEELHIIEVQLGDVLTEEDIERCGHFWD